MSQTFLSLILSEGEEEDVMDHGAEYVVAAAGDNINDDNKDGASMPPKVKHVSAEVTKTAEKNQEGR